MGSDGEMKGQKIRHLKDNRGFSLVELIVVIAVVAILAAGTAYGVVNLTSWRVDECVKGIDAALNETSINAMSRENCYLTLFQKSNGNYYVQVSGKQEEKLGSDALTITYTVSNGTTGTISASQSLMITYDRSSGAFMPIITGVDGGGNLSFGTGYCTSITVSIGGSRAQTIKLSKDTGKHYMED